MKRVYTKKSFELMKKTRLFFLILFSPIWIPIWLIYTLGMYAEDVLDYLDDKLDKLLDIIIPQIK